jgi:hypothetical protein
MAIIKLNPLFEDAHGKIGDMVFRRGPNGKTILSRAPRKKPKKSQKAQKAQKAQNARQKQRMLEAHDYAHAAMKDPEMRAYYQQKADREGKCAYRLAFGGFFKIER